MLFSWLTPLLVLGWKQQLRDADLPTLLPEDTMSETGRALLQAWNLEVVKKQLNPKRAALFRSMWNVYWPNLLLSGMFKVVNDLVVFIGPMLLQQLIRFIENADENRSIADGAFIAVGIFLAKTVESFALGQYFHIGYRLGSQVRPSLCAHRGSHGCMGALRRVPHVFTPALHPPPTRIRARSHAPVRSRALWRALMPQ